MSSDRNEPAGTKYKTFFSRTINGEVSYLIYLPPDYDTDITKRYPVLYWLHGSHGTQSRGGIVVALMDEAIRQGKAPPMIMVLVNGLSAATMYCDSSDGRWPLETVLIQDLIPHIDASYSTIPRRETRAIEGFSMGGYGAAHLGFKYPETFGVVSILAPALLDETLPGKPGREWPGYFSFAFGSDASRQRAESPFELAAKNAAALRGRTSIRLVAHDEREHWLIPRCEALHAVLDAHGIAHELAIRRDVTQHNPVPLYRALGDNAFAFYTRAFAASAASRPPGKTRAQVPAETTRPTAAGRVWLDQRASENPLLQLRHFHSNVIQADVSYAIYTPPGYERETQRRYPVVYWLHGGKGSQRDCGTFVTMIDRAIKAGQCPEMLVVGVNGMGGDDQFPGGQYCDWKDGTLPMESVIIKDLLPHIDATWRTLGQRAGRAIEGFSMGGRGALTLALRHPELFAAVTAIGPALLQPDSGIKRVDEFFRNGALQGDVEYWSKHDPFQLAEKRAGTLRGQMYIRLISGEQEGTFTYRRAAEFHTLLTKLDLPHEFIRPGATGHNYVKVYEAMPRAYEFYARVFATAAKPASASIATEVTALAADSPDAAPAGRAPSARGGPPRWVDPDVTPPSGTLYRTFRSDTIKGEASYLVYLPPDYEKDAARRYPTLYWLHGGGGNQRGGTRFVAQLDRAIRAGQAPPMVVILVNGLPSGFYNDSADGLRPVESVIVRDLIPHVDATYRTIANRAGRGLEGFSMGGYGAAHLGFKYPELFGVVSNLAGAVIDVEFFATYQNGRILQETFNGDRAAFERNHPLTLAKQNAAAIRGRTFVRILVGDADTGRGTLEANRALHRALEELGIAHDYLEVPGVQHNFVALYDKMGADAFVFFKTAFAAANEAKP